jgi:ComF family protein
VLRSPSGLTQTLWNDLVTTVFPADCRVCSGPLLRAGLVPVCDACAGALSPQKGSLCGCCGEALGHNLDLESYEDQRFLDGMMPEGVLCSACLEDRPAFAQAVAFGLYDDELRTMVHLLKYERVEAIARPLGAKLAAAIRTLRPLADDMLTVIAVPLFPAREAQRGYNQSILLADAAIALLKKSDPAWRLTAAHRAIIRTRNTESQYSLSVKGRHTNLRGAFEVIDPAAIAGKEILLIDDIYTTGATTRECARILRKAGAAKVWVATLSRAQTKSSLQIEEPEAAVAFWN